MCADPGLNGFLMTSRSIYGLVVRSGARGRVGLL